MRGSMMLTILALSDVGVRTEQRKERDSALQSFGRYVGRKRQCLLDTLVA